MRATRLLLAPILLVGCSVTTHRADGPGDARARELEARIARLEASAKAASLDDEILALEVRRVGLLVIYTSEHPAVLDLDRKIEGVKRVRVLEERVRRDAMRRRLEVERETLLGTYTADHPSVARLDAQIAFLKADVG